MNLGLSGVLDKMESMGSLQNASKYWSAGDRVGYLFAIDGFEEDGVTPRIPVGYLAGHSVDLGEGYGRSFLTTTVELDPKTNAPLSKDFLYRAAGVASALLKGEFELAMQEKEKLYHGQPERLTIEKGNVETSYENKYPAIGSMQIRAYTEVGVFKLDVNNKVQGPKVGFQRASLVLTKKRAKMLVQKIQENGVYIPGTNYVYVYMSTLTGDKKEAGKVDYNAINDTDKKLENIKDANQNLLNPGFADEATRFVNSLSLSSDTILAKVFDARPWDEAEFKSALATYIAPREYQLKDMDGNYFDFVRREDNVEVLRALGRVASAEQIEALLDKKENEAPFENVPTGDDSAQSLDIGETAPTGDVPEIESDPFAMQKDA